MLVWERSELLDAFGECAARMGFAVSAGGPSGLIAGDPPGCQCAAYITMC